MREEGGRRKAGEHRPPCEDSAPLSVGLAEPAPLSCLKGLCQLRKGGYVRLQLSLSRVIFYSEIASV